MTSSDYKKGATTARPGLRLRNSPRDGDTISVLPPGSELEILSEETWFKVRTNTGEVGFVLADYVDTIPQFQSPTPTSTDRRDEPKARLIDYQAKTARLHGKPLRIEQGFAEYMSQIEDLLDKYDLCMWITSSLRESNAPVSNAIVDPAKLSNHLVGHAIDMNLYRGDDWFNSKRLAKVDVHSLASQESLLGDNEKRVCFFLKEIHDHSVLRWGGVWSKPDPVHIDDCINLRHPDLYRKFFRQLWEE